ncbi:hypothetical protein [Alienimonas chondri]|uniref:DUF3068 domain-containing protein n=1 Tax=Alienimonas chondri TaxID=2681879 RepID=A0ABX1VIM1_9PLAN|nr:hypothetical protein [Alienimonas chondri]NNJ26671.1 hypothetical protein [Alienimonas chondri]
MAGDEPVRWEALLNPSLLAAVLLTFAPPAPSQPPPAPLPTAAELADGLRKVRAAVRDVHLVWQERSQAFSAPNVPRGVLGGEWGELFVEGDATQVRFLYAASPAGVADWWPAGTSADSPLTGAAVADNEFLVAQRPPGKGPARITRSSWTTPGPGQFSDQIALTDADRVVFRPHLIPHLGVGRWDVDREQEEAPTGFDGLAAFPPARWVVDGREVKDGRPAVRVTILYEEPSGITYEPSYLAVRPDAVLPMIAHRMRAWFTDDVHHDLFRVEHATSRLIGADHAPTDPLSSTYWAEDFRPLANGVRMPFAGGRILYADAAVPPGETTSSGLSNLEGSAASPAQFVAHRHEWRIETLEPLDPAITAADLWVEPPYGAQVHDAATGKQRIAGLTDLESWLIFKFNNRYAAWWAFGPPLALCGLVALGLWWRRRRRRWASA